MKNLTLIHSSQIRFCRCFLVLWFITSPLIAQVKPLKQLTRNDYHLWGDVNINSISADGNWINYKISYSNGTDTLFVKGTKGYPKFIFPKGVYGIFSSSGYFACKSTEGLKVINLSTGKTTLYQDVKSFNFSRDGQKLVILKSQNTSVLQVLNVKGKTLLSLNNVVDYTINKNASHLIYTMEKDSVSKSGIVFLEKQVKHQILATDTNSKFSDFVWNSDKAVAFYKSKNNMETSILFYNINKNQLYEFTPPINNEFWNLNTIKQDWKYKLTISRDLEKVFFAAGSKTFDKTLPDDGVQIWNGNSKYVYPQQQILKKQEHLKLCFWQPTLGNYQVLNSVDKPWVMVTGNYKYAIYGNPETYEPQFDDKGPMDFYIKDLNSGTTKLLLNKHSSYELHTLPSPTGKYIAYFKSGNWFVYNIKNGEHKNITQNINSHFENQFNVIGGEIEACGIAGWTAGDKTILIYDNYDIWEYRFETDDFKRLTNGKEKKIVFRISPEAGVNILKKNFDGYQSKVIAPLDKLLLRASGEHGESGYFTWEDSNGERPIVYKNSLIDQSFIADKNFVYREQRFDISPRIISINKEKKNTSLAQSNVHQKKYYWGTAREINYSNKTGQNLKGYLCYPAGYIPGKKYPMIVHIYQTQFQDFNTYALPMEEQSEGFDPLMFISDGYLVLYPNIVNGSDQAGTSAAEWVLAATNKVIEMGVVDSDRIGLIGHSFGGYETNYIITQTNLFAAAVSGGGISDLQSYYLGINWTTGKPDTWRLENQQWHMSNSLFENRSKYFENSPISFAENIQTPLLLWSGRQDTQVNWHQSVEFYLALRRLKKKQIMLLYPDEGHSLMKPDNQMDLVTKIKDWFDYFLKKEKIKWIDDGVK